jgi:hypothetical protein
MSVGDARPIQPGGWYGRTTAALRRPWAQALAGLALIGLLALLYLNQVASVAVANARLRNLRAEQTQLERQDSQLHQQLGGLTSPAYVDQRARALGLAPDPTVAAVILALDGPLRTGGRP